MVVETHGFLMFWMSWSFSPEERVSPIVRERMVIRSEMVIGGVRRQVRVRIGVASGGLFFLKMYETCRVECRCFWQVFLLLRVLW